MIISFLFLIFSAAMFIDCKKDGGPTNVKKNPVNNKATIMKALARIELTMQRQSQQLQAVENSVANLQTTVTELRVKETEDVSALRTKITEDVSALRLKMAEDNSALAGKLKVAEGQKARFPVAFTAHFPRDHPNNGISLGHHSILRLDRVVTNIGDAYDAHTGIFTAPVNGVYVFFVSIMGTETKGVVAVAIVKQNKVLDVIYTVGGSAHQGSGLVTTNMTAGQQLYVRQNSGTAVRGSWWTVFSGYLL